MRMAPAGLPESSATSTAEGASPTPPFAGVESSVAQPAAEKDKGLNSPTIPNSTEPASSAHESPLKPLVGSLAQSAEES